MDHPILQAEISAPRRRYPLAAMGGLCALMAFTMILFSGLYNISVASTILPLAVMGCLAVILTILDLRIGLGLLIFAIGVSPELSIMGVSNLRLEDFLFPVVMMVWLFRAVTNKENFAPTNLKTPILLMVLLSTVSSLYNIIYSGLDPVACTFRVGKSVEYFLIFVVTLNTLRRSEDLRAIIYLMPLVSALVGIYGLCQSAGSQDRVTGPVGETSNILGGYLVFHLCIVLGLIASGAKYRIALLISAGLMLLPLMGTMSRTSYIALLFGLVTLFITKRNVWTSLVLVGSVLVLFSSSETSSRFYTIFQAIQGDAPSSLTQRVQGWIAFLKWLPVAPILGQGIGHKNLGAFDSEYVRLLYELGIFGLLIFGWMMALIIRASHRLATRSRDPVFRGFALGCFGGTVALLVHSIAATTFTTIRTGECFFFATGILYALALQNPENTAEQEELPHDLPPRRVRRMTSLLGHASVRHS